MTDGTTDGRKTDGASNPAGKMTAVGAKDMDRKLDGTMKLAAMLEQRKNE